MAVCSHGGMNDRQYGELLQAILDLRQATEDSMTDAHSRSEQQEERWNRRFNALETRMEDGFRQVDDRFQQIDVRFGQTDGRFDKMDVRFGQMGYRFDKIDVRFGQMDDRFDKMDLRFDQLDERVGTLVVRIFGSA